ncbi:metalloendopeptidase-like membrane protein [Saprospira grandis DSM 2844]|uniref:Metalloendopeptidase-like membrane protein n=1 Tax=Saprospira grandis DSM 2844 TaxID=694433 RepID=J1I543_9BACT|nr:M23 family metallopeptidase [Saprospira grandis]EJF53875.1 metalloendopeptidase-like membrane protein [Saprospira grandis DSM 2844]
MSKDKYIYNPQTLRYEKVKVSKRKRYLQLALFFVMIVGFSIGIVYLASAKPTDDKQEAHELKLIKSRYEEMTDQLDLMEEALENLHERDVAIYRQVLELDPNDEAYWTGGRGGSNKYAGLENLSDAELIKELLERVLQMRQRLALMAKAQEEVLLAAKEKQELLQAIPSIRPLRRLQRRIEYLSGFGYRKHPIYKILKMHTGIDFGAPIGTPIYATGNGKVAKVVLKRTGYGRHVIIDHGHGYKTLYAHMSKVEVKAGEKVKRGEIIGRVGNTGASTAPHLHYEVVYKGKKVNPLPFCRDGLDNQEYKEFIRYASQQNQALSIHK